MIPGYTNIGPGQYSFTTGNKVVDDIFGVNHLVYSDNTKSEVLITNGKHKMYWNTTDKTLNIDGTQITDLNTNLLRVLQYYNSSNKRCYPNSTDLCKLSSVYSIRNSDGDYHIEDTKHRHLFVGRIFNVIPDYIEHKLYLQGGDIELLVADHRIRNIEIHKIGDKYISGVGTGGLIAVIGDTTYRMRIDDYKKYIMTGSLGDVEIMRSVKRST